MTVQSAAQTDRAREVKVLITAASLHGATSEIAAALGEELSGQGLSATVIPPEAVNDVESYDAVIIGSAVYTGHWLAPAKDLVHRYLDVLASRPVWLFSSGPVGDPSGKLSQAMRKDPVDVAALSTATRARGHVMFAGKLDPKMLSRPQRTALLIFRGLNGDFRDWSAIREWARSIAQELTPVPR
jgi:menaquinone-dependent protoporphyrinogen oxidase